MLLFVWMGHFEFPPNRCFIYKKTTTNVRFVMHMNSYHCGICRLYVKNVLSTCFRNTRASNVKLTGVLKTKQILKSIIVLWLCVVNTFFKNLLHLVFKLQTLYEYRPMHMVPQMPCVVNSSLVVDKQGETEKGSQMPTVFAHWKSIG